MKSVENGVQAKSVIENFVAEGYSRDHIHLFAHSDRRAEDIAKLLNVDASATGETTDNENTGFFETIKNFFQPTPEDLPTQLNNLGLSSLDQNTAQNDLDAGKLVIVAHHP